MTIEIRAPRDDERERMHKIVQQAFAVSGRPYNEDEDRSGVPLERRLAAVDGERIVGSWKTWEMGQWFGGKRVQMGAISAVAVVPEYRSRGVGSSFARRALTEMRERGEVIASLYPMNHTFYRRHGWELAGTFPQQQLEMRAVLDLPRLARDFAGGEKTDNLSVRETKVDDLPKLRELGESIARLEQGNLSYGPEFASHRMLGWEGYQEGYVVEEDGEIKGVVVLGHVEHSQGSDEMYTVDVRCMVAADLDSELALWRLLGSHYPMARTLKFVAPPNSAVPALLGERGMRPTGWGWTWMTRLVDAPAAIAARGYSPEVDVELALDITDDSASWNAGPHVLRIKDGIGQLEPGGPGTVEVTIGRLASLYTSWANPRVLARLGFLPGAEDSDLAALTSAFAGPTPWSRDFF